MSFINTVETVGDKALADSIIDRSITELNCNITTTIRQYAFRACAALEKVSFPSVTSIALGAFWQCTALTRAEFESTVAFANNAFYGCTNLTVLILRNTEAMSTITGTPFEGSAIASGTGYIYVPAALVDTYKANWTAYAAQIRAIEDYVEITDPYSWAAVAKCIGNGSYASVYKVGDLVPLDLGSGGLVNMQIAAFDADDLADGSGKAPISWISKELLKTNRKMNPALESTTDENGATVYTEGTGAIGGWEKCEMRTYLRDTIKPLIPSEVQAMIKTVTKYSNGFDTNGTKVIAAASEDDVWIPSKYEVDRSESYESTGVNYRYLFVNAESKLKKRNTTYATWWYRTAYSTNEYIGHGNEVNKGIIAKSTSLNGIALGFCT